MSNATTEGTLEATATATAKPLQEEKQEKRKGQCMHHLCRSLFACRIQKRDVEP